MISNWDFTIIFDGNNLNDCQMAGHGKFVLKEEDAFQSEGWMRLLCYTKEICGNFILKWIGR